MKNRNWLPLDKRTLKSDFQLTDKEEIAKAEIIRKVYDDHNIPITNDIVKQVAIRYYYLKHEKDPNHQFSASIKKINNTILSDSR